MIVEHRGFPLWFFLLWIFLGLVGLWLFYINKDVRLKNRLFPWFVIVPGVLFSVFAYSRFRQPRILLFILPAVALISYLNLRSIRFCEACGAMVHNTFLARPSFCPKCGGAVVSPE